MTPPADPSPASSASLPRSVDRHDRELVRRMLALTPEQRLRSVAAAYPLVRIGLVRRIAAGGARRP